MLLREMSCWGVSQSEAHLDLGSRLGAVGHSLSIPSLYAFLGYLILGPLCQKYVWFVGMANTPEIYGDRGQCPAARGKGKTVFLDFLRKGATFSSQ